MTSTVTRWKYTRYNRWTKWLWIVTMERLLCREDAPNAHPHSPKAHNTYNDTCSGVHSGQPTYGWCSYSIANVLWSSPRHGAHPSQTSEPFLKHRNSEGSYHIRQLAKQWTRTKYSLCYNLSGALFPKDPNKCSELRRKLELLPCNMRPSTSRGSLPTLHFSKVFGFICGLLTTSRK